MLAILKYINLRTLILYVVPVVSLSMILYLRAENKEIQGNMKVMQLSYEKRLIEYNQQQLKAIHVMQEKSEKVYKKLSEKSEKINEEIETKSKNIDYWVSINDDYRLFDPKLEAYAGEQTYSSETESKYPSFTTRNKEVRKSRGLSKETSRNLIKYAGDAQKTLEALKACIEWNEVIREKMEEL